MASRANFSPLNNSNARNPMDNRRELLGGPSGQQGLNNPAYQPASSMHPQSELEQMHLQINKTTDQSLDSTRRMVGLLEESQEAGAKTMENLYRQGEQLDKVEDNLDTMNADMKEAERNMQQMEKCCGLCVCPWRKRKNFERTSNYQKTFGKGVDVRNGDRGDTEVITMEQPNVENVRFQGQRDPYVQRITNDAREDEMEDNLTAVGGMLGGLKNMAQDMGSEISKHNQQLDRMNQKAIVTDDRVTAANLRANEILKKA